MWKRFKKWYKSKQSHRLFPLLPPIAGIVVGNMLDQPIITVIFVSVFVYLVLVIFIPWKKAWISYIIPALICLAIVIPFWNTLISQFSDDPFEQKIATATSTVKIIVNTNLPETNREIPVHYISAGGSLYFVKGNEALLATAASDCYGRQVGENRVLYYGTFNMDATSSATKEAISYLQQADYILIGFDPPEIPDEIQILDGLAVVVFNDSVRLEFKIPPQLAKKNGIIIRDLTPILGSEGSQTE